MPSGLSPTCRRSARRPRTRERVRDSVPLWFHTFVLSPVIEVHEPGDVYARDDFVYWGFSAEGLRRLGRIVGLDEVEVVDELEIDAHPRILALLRAAG